MAPNALLILLLTDISKSCVQDA